MAETLSLEQQIALAEQAVYRSDMNLRKHSAQFTVALKARAKVIGLVAAGVALVTLWFVPPRTIGRWLSSLSRETLTRVVPTLVPFLAPFIGRKSVRSRSHDSGKGGGWMTLVMWLLPLVLKRRSKPAGRERPAGQAS